MLSQTSPIKVSPNVKMMLFVTLEEEEPVLNAYAQVFPPELNIAA